MSSYKLHTIYSLKVKEIESDPSQPRKHFDTGKLNELADSIKQHGVIQPIIVRSEDNKIILVAGERRLKASQKAGLEEIPSIFVQGDNSAEISLIENLQREDLTAIEEAEALDRIRVQHEYKAKELSQIMGKAQSTISETLTLVRLPEKIRNECRNDPSWSRRVLLEIAKLKSETEMLKLFKKVQKKNLKSEELRLQTRKGGKHNPKPVVFVKRISGLRDYFSKMNVDDFKDQDIKSVKEELVSLKTTIEGMLEKFGTPKK